MGEWASSTRLLLYAIKARPIYTRKQRAVSFHVYERRSQARHELPPAPAPPAQNGAGVGPAFSEDDVVTGTEVEEHPGSALDRELVQKHAV